MRAVATGFDLYEAISPDVVVDLPRFTMNNLLTYEIYVGSLGDVTAVRQDGVAVTFVAVPAGTRLPIAVRRINATGTTAMNLVALYNN